MNKTERIIIVTILFGISVVTAIDLVTDSQQGVPLWHLCVEGLVALGALAGVLLLVRDTFRLKQTLIDEIEFSAKFKKEANVWKENSKKYLDGLSESIDSQLSRWKLTKSEKEVAFLLLKGFSLNEVGNIRGTTEKTARAQAAAVYAKADISGRSQLSAFFLEDLLPPQEAIANPCRQRS